jgi:hypothetical protein
LRGVISTESNEIGVRCRCDQRCYTERGAAAVAEFCACTI